MVGVNSDYTHCPTRVVPRSAGADRIGNISFQNPSKNGPCNPPIPEQPSWARSPFQKDLVLEFIDSTILSFWLADQSHPSMRYGDLTPTISPRIRLRKATPKDIRLSAAKQGCGKRDYNRRRSLFARNATGAPARRMIEEGSGTELWLPTFAAPICIPKINALKSL